MDAEVDELIQPKQWKNGNCELCGNEGQLYMVEVGEKAESIPELIEKRVSEIPQKTVEEVIEEMEDELSADDAEWHEFQKYRQENPTHVLTFDTWRMEARVLSEADDAVTEVMVPPEPQTSGAEPEVPEEAPVEVEKTPPLDTGSAEILAEENTSPEPTENVTDTAVLDELAALRAKIAELEAEKE